MVDQLPLNLERTDRHRMELFHCGVGVEEAWAQTEAIIERRARFAFLWGESGSGKTHLLEGAAQRGFGSYLDLGAVQPEVAKVGWEPELLLDALPGDGLVALDNVAVVAGDAIWERALFQLYNRLFEEGGRLLVAAETSPYGLGLAREELRTRLLWGGSYRLGRLTDDERLMALRGHFAARGLELKETVGVFLLRHYPRNMHQLMGVVERLDLAARAEQRRLTLPFVKSQLGL